MSFSDDEILEALLRMKNSDRSRRGHDNIVGRKPATSAPPAGLDGPHGSSAPRGLPAATRASCDQL